MSEIQPRITPYLRLRRAIAITALTVTILAGCDSTSRTDGGAADGNVSSRNRHALENVVGRWELQSLLGETMNITTPISMVVAVDGTMSGRSAVNGYSGALDPVGLRKGEFEAYPIASTMMAGAPERMELEARYFRGLERARTWSISEAALVLHDGEVEVARFRRGAE